MEEKNTSSWKEFLLLGLQYQKSPTIFLVAVGFMFFIAIIGNCLLLIVISADSTLDTPMYFFLRQLALLDLCQIVPIVAQVFVSYETKRYTISLYGCVVQITVTLLLGGAECLILATMSYDRYVAICKPHEEKHPSCDVSGGLVLVLSPGTVLLSLCPAPSLLQIQCD
ncbi:hypothetical protein Chor_011455 [Crotalus horridus]